MYRSKFAFLLLMLSMLSTGLYGQAYISLRSEMDQVVTNTRFQVGPFRLFPSIQIRQFGWDDNIYRRSEDKVSDFTLILSPELTTYLLFHESLILSLRVNPEYVFYYDQRNLRGWNSSVSPEIRWRILGGFVLSGSYFNNTTRQRPSNEFAERVNQKIEGFSASVFLERPNNSAFGIVASSDERAYQDVSDPESGTPSSRLDREENHIGFEMYYPIFTDSSFFLKTGYSEYNFKQLASQINDSYSYQFVTGIGFPVLGRMRGTLSLGYKKFTPRALGPKEYSGFFGDTSLEYRFSRFHFRILYARDIPFSQYSGSIYFIEKRIGGGLSYYLTPFMRLDYNIGNINADYPDTILIPTGDDSFEEVEYRRKYSYHSGAVVFRLVRNIGLGVTLDYLKRDSNVPGQGSATTYTGLYLTYDF